MTDIVPPEEQYYSVKRVKEIFDVTAETVRNWIDRGLLDAIKIEGQWRITQSSVRKLANSKHGPPS